MKTILTILISLPIFCFSQKQGNIWYFGDNAGVDFSSGAPVALTDGAMGFANHLNMMGNPIQYSEGTSAISDSNIRIAPTSKTINQ